MSLFLKNYTSNVPVSNTIHRIEQVLIRCGAKSIAKEYGSTGNITAIVFTIEIENGRTMPVRLPANEDAAWNALWLDYVDGDKLNAEGTHVTYPSQKKKCKANFKEQAERTAWKIVQDWVEVQMSMIQLRQAETMQVFMPYAWDDRAKVTFYDRMKLNGFRAMLPENAGGEQ